MKLYSEHKVNPFASCLPILAQLPVFISLFYLLQDDLRRDICGQSERPCGESAASNFLFIPDITDNATGLVLITLIVLYVGTQLASSIMSTVSMDKNQRLLMLGLPFFFVAFIWQFPAGLLVYWITTNAWTIVQQAIVKKRLGPLRPPPDKDNPPANPFADLKALFSQDQEETKSPPKAPRGASPATAAVTAAPKGRPSGPPPPSPRKKKKRSGRRR